MPAIPGRDTGYPAAVVNRLGKGTSVYFAGQPDRLFNRQGHPDYEQLLVNAVTCGTPVPPVQVEAPNTIEVTTWQLDGGGYLLHLMNHTHDALFPSPATGIKVPTSRDVFRAITQVIPVHGIKIHLASPGPQNGRLRAQLLGSDLRSTVWESGVARVDLPLFGAAWRPAFESLLNAESEATFDEAYAIRLDFVVTDVGRASVTAEREFAPVRWIARGGRSRVELLNATAVPAEVSIASCASPGTIEEVSYSRAVDGIRCRATSPSWRRRCRQPSPEATHGGPRRPGHRTEAVGQGNQVLARSWNLLLRSLYFRRGDDRRYGVGP